MMPLPFLITRKAIEEDYFPLWQLRNDVTVRRWLKVAISYKDFILEMESPQNMFIAGLVGTDVVGYAHLHLLSTKSAAVFIAVKPQCRNMGYGNQLCQSAVDWANKSGLTELVSAIEPINQAGLSFAENCKFAFNGEVPSKQGFKKVYVRRSRPALGL